MVNGRRVSSTLFRVARATWSKVAEKAKNQLRIKGAAEAAESRGHPEWLEVDAKALKGKFKARPQRTELPSTINESLVVELYSK
jgi:small subunit ribosomal protein S4